MLLLVLSRSGIIKRRVPSSIIKRRVPSIYAQNTVSTCILFYYHGWCELCRLVGTAPSSVLNFDEEKQCSTSLEQVSLREMRARLACTVVLVVRSDLILGDLAGAVRVEVIGHVVTLRLHVSAHLIERRGGDEMARAVHLPRDRGPHRANIVVSGRTGGGTGVVGDLLTLVAVDDHASHEVRVVVVLVVDDGEHLRLHANIFVEIVIADHSIERSTINVAKNPVVEWSLVLVRRTTRAHG